MRRYPARHRILSGFENILLHRARASGRSWCLGGQGSLRCLWSLPCLATLLRDNIKATHRLRILFMLPLLLEKLALGLRI